MTSINTHRARYTDVQYEYNCYLLQIHYLTLIFVYSVYQCQTYTVQINHYHQLSVS